MGKHSVRRTLRCELCDANFATSIVGTFLLFTLLPLVVSMKGYRKHPIPLAVAFWCTLTGVQPSTFFSLFADSVIQRICVQGVQVSDSVIQRGLCPTRINQSDGGGRAAPKYPLTPSHGLQGTAAGGELPSAAGKGLSRRRESGNRVAMVKKIGRLVSVVDKCLV